MFAQPIQSLLSTVVAADGAPQGGGLMDLLFPLAIVFLIFWFLVIRPSSRERKEREMKVRNIEKHDKVITNAGIYGTVVGLDDETVTRLAKVVEPMLDNAN